MDLREYQIDAILKIRNAMSNGNKHILLQAACGSGKTIISSEIVRLAIEKNKKVLFLVNRRDLVKQAVDKYTDYGLDNNIGVIMAGEDSDLYKPIQCASLQTYGRRLNLDDPEHNKWFHDADLLIYDECHSANAPTYRAIINNYKDKYIIGLSATPMGAKGSGLGEVFDEIISCIPISELIEQGHLVPAIHYAPSKPDLEKIGIVAGDYNQKELGERVDKPKLVGDIYLNWAKLASGRKTIIFATNVKHSKHIKEVFEENGVNVVHMDAHTNDEDRAEIYNGFENGNIQVLTNVGICCEGSDLPIASCIVVARPTLLISRWIQMAGRGARPYPGKENFLLLDHSGCIDRHGFIDDDIYWSLDSKKPAARKKSERKKEKKIIICDECTFAFTGNKCPQCGFKIPDYGKRINTVDAELIEIGKSKIPKPSMQDKRIWYGMLEYERRRLGKTDKWLLAQYKTKFGVWPRGMENVGPTEPNIDVKNWLTYQRIKWIKGKQKQYAN